MHLFLVMQPTLSSITPFLNIKLCCCHPRLLHLENSLSELFSKQEINKGHYFEKH